MHAEGILSGELKHGPLAMIDNDTPCIMILMRDNTYTVCLLAFRSSNYYEHMVNRIREGMSSLAINNFCIVRLQISYCLSCCSLAICLT